LQDKTEWALGVAASDVGEANDVDDTGVSRGAGGWGVGSRGVQGVAFAVAFYIGGDRETGGRARMLAASLLSLLVRAR
jgi:hypothetical protein